MKSNHILHIGQFTVAIFWGLIITIGFQGLSHYSGLKNSDVLENIKHKGVLRVATRNMSTSYYEHHDQPAGPEYDLAKSFAEHLGVKLDILVKDSLSDLMLSIAHGEADIIAAGITRTEKREEIYRFGSDYQSIQQLVVCSDIRKLPQSPAELINYSISVIADSSYEETLKEWEQSTHKLAWKTSEYHTTEQIIEHLTIGDLECTLADSNIVAINRRYYPKLKVAFAATEPQQLAWVLPNNAAALNDELQLWFEESQNVGIIASILETYYGHVDMYDHYDLSVFRDRIRKRLPKYKKQLEKSATKMHLPWTLLAAQAYQESHWDPKAKSPTGVRGLMMLTNNTAKSMGVIDRLNPIQSIKGGSKYLRKMIDRLPESIIGDDRLYLGLVAYNIGMGHLLDARKLAVSLNKNPDIWVDMKSVLPLLSVKSHYRQLKHGYARGNDSVRYIERIRNYEDVLKKELIL